MTRICMYQRYQSQLVYTGNLEVNSLVEAPSTDLCGPQARGLQESWRYHEEILRVFGSIAILTLLRYHPRKGRRSEPPTAYVEYGIGYQRVRLFQV